MSGELRVLERFASRGVRAAEVGQEFHSDDSAATFEGALREQLGVRLVPQKGTWEYFAVDHVEHPSSK